MNSNHPEDFDYVLRNLKHLHKMFQTHLNLSKWEKILEITDEISSHVSSFQMNLQDPVKSDLINFVEDFSNYNPLNDPEQDLKNFEAYLITSGVSKNLNKLICELRMVSFPNQKAA